jgi:hypothetical protein
MNKLLIAAHVLLMFAAAAAAGLLTSTAARADHVEVMLLETEITPLPANPITESKWDRRFANYELENSSCCGVQ